VQSLAVLYREGERLALASLEAGQASSVNGGQAWHLVTGTWAARYNGSLEARPSMQAYRHACDHGGALAIGMTLSRDIASAASGFVSVLGVDDCAAGDDTPQRDLLQTSSAVVCIRLH
jgi:hypothetical protein